MTVVARAGIVDRISISLEQLSDVTITSVSSGQFLSWNGTNWVNASGGGGGGLSSFTSPNSTITIGGTLTDPTVDINLANANTWTGQQTFNTSAPIFGTMTSGSVLFAGTSGLLSQDNANFFWDDTNYRLGIGVATPSFDLSFGQSGNRVIEIERRLGSNFAGRLLTLQAGGATAGQTNKPGGSLILSAGTSTGSSSLFGSVSIAIPLANASGSGDNAPTTILTFSPGATLASLTNNPFSASTGNTVFAISDTRSFTGASSITQQGLSVSFDDGRTINSGSSDTYTVNGAFYQSSTTFATSGLTTNHNAFNSVLNGIRSTFTTGSQTFNLYGYESTLANINPVCNVGGGNTLTYNVISYDASLPASQLFPTITSGTLNTNYYGFRVNATGVSGLGAHETGYGVYVNLSGFDTQYAGIFLGANVGIGTATPASLLTVGASGQFQVNSSGVVTNGSWQASQIDVTHGGTGSNLSATGGTSQVLQQTSTGAAITVGQLAASDLSNGTIGSGAIVLAAAPTLSGLIYVNVGCIEEKVYANGNSGTSFALNLDNGNLQTITISGAVAITQTTPTNPGKYTLIVTQDNSGHVYSLSGLKFPNGTAPTYSTAANKIDVMSIAYDGTNYYCMGLVSFS